MMQPRASIFGGSWINGDNAGSRYANVDNWPENSNGHLGARGRSDQRDCRESGNRRGRDRRVRLLVEGQNAVSGGTLARCRLRPHRPAKPAWSARMSCFGEYIARSGRAGRRRSSFSRLGLSRPAAGFLQEEISMRILDKGRNYLSATHKGASIEIERESDGRFYIIVKWKDGGTLYDGWAPETVRTMAAAKLEARRGAMLDSCAGPSE